MSAEFVAQNTNYTFIHIFVVRKLPLFIQLSQQYISRKLEQSREINTQP